MPVDSDSSLIDVYVSRFVGPTGCTAIGSQADVYYVDEDGRHRVDGWLANTYVLRDRSRIVELEDVEAIPESSEFVLCGYVRIAGWRFISYGPHAMDYVETRTRRAVTDDVVDSLNLTNPTELTVLRDLGGLGQADPRGAAAPPMTRLLHGRCIKSPRSESLFLVLDGQRFPLSQDTYDRLYRDAEGVVTIEHAERLPLGASGNFSGQIESYKGRLYLNGAADRKSFFREISEAARLAYHLRTARVLLPDGVGPSNGLTIDLPKQVRPDLNGRRVQVPGNPRVYLVDNGFRRSIENPRDYERLLSSNVPVLTDPFAAYIPEGPPLLNPKIVHPSGNEHLRYMLDGGWKRLIKDGAAHDAWGFALSFPLATPAEIALPNGPEISAPSWNVRGDWSAIFDGQTCAPMSDVTFLYDGREAFPAMYREMEIAESEGDFIYLLGWWLDYDFPLDGATGTSFLDVARRKSKVQVRALLRRTALRDVSDGAPNQEAVSRINQLPNGEAFWDDIVPSIAGAHHQKLLIVKHRGGLVAFCGGVDMNKDRIQSVRGEPGTPYKDVHCRIDGPAARALLAVFEARWYGTKPWFVPSKGPLRSRETGIGMTRFPGMAVRVSTTWNKGYVDSMKGYHKAFCLHDRTVQSTLVAAIDAAKKFIYVEDQYFYSGTAVANALSRAAERGVWILVLTNDPANLAYPTEQGSLRKQFFWLIRGGISPAATMRFWVFYRIRPANGTKFGPESYVHSKVWVVDDHMAIVGSANCCNRSLANDSEVSAAFIGRPYGQRRAAAASLRQRLWANHLGVTEAELPDPLADPVIVLQFWDRHASGHVELAYQPGVPPPGYEGSVPRSIVDPDGGALPQCARLGI